MTDKIDRSSKRFHFLIDAAHDTGIGCQAIDELGNFHVGAAVAVLVDLLDHLDEAHRIAARGSLLRIRNSAGELWLGGSLNILYDNARKQEDRHIRRNAMSAWVDCLSTKMFVDRLVQELMGSDESDVIFAARLAAKVPNHYIATRLCWMIGLDKSRSELVKMTAAKALAEMVHILDIESAAKVMRVIGGTTTSLLNHPRNDDEFDFLLFLFAEVYRSIGERLNDFAHGIRE